MAYIATSDVTEYGSFTGTADNALIARLITRSQDAIEEYTGRFFEDQAVSTRRFEASVDTEGQILFLNQDLLEFGSDGIVAGTDIIFTGSTTGVVFNTNFVPVPRSDKPIYELRIRDGSSLTWGNPNSDGDYEDVIAVNGIWAYSSVAPADIVHANLRLVLFYYKQAQNYDGSLDRPLLTADGITIMPSALPADVIQILDRYKRPVFK